MNQISPAPSMPLLQVDQLSRHYGPNIAVDHVSFTLDRGEVLGFLGPNGAGKSTTMKMITGNLAPSSGSAVINGFDILNEPKQAKAAIGFLPEQPPLYRDLTVNEYLDFAARINRISKSSLTRAIDNAKQRCGLEQMGKRLIGNLSKGFQQRVGIAQAIIHSPELVILDEPTVGLDPIQIREIRQLIRELGKEHSVILSTHILPEVQSTCDRVQIINQGELVFCDSIAGLTQQMQTTALLVRMKRPPTDSSLLAITGIQELQWLDKNSCRIHFSPEQNPAEALVQGSVQEDWGIYELTPERMSLEEVFVELTHNEPLHEESQS